MSNLKYRRRHFYNSPKAGIVYCGSSYELKTATILDADEKVRFYETQIGFVGKTGKRRFIDFLVTYKDGDKWIIEVKPVRRLDEFKEQIEDNRAYAIEQGYGFKVWTESDLGFNKEQEARNWADRFLSQFYNEDYTQIRKERCLIRSKKHYRKKVASDKIIFLCEFCKEEHSPLRITYEKNIKKNGRFICIKENGHIIGSLPKTKNQDSEKRCRGKCGRLLPTDCFSKGKAICKECRAEIYRSKYQSVLEVKNFKYISKKDLQ